MSADRERVAFVGFEEVGRHMIRSTGKAVGVKNSKTRGKKGGKPTVTSLADRVRFSAEWRAQKRGMAGPTARLHVKINNAKLNFLSSNLIFFIIFYSKF